jgi:hypothetical protein
MPTERLSMRQSREILRQKWLLGRTHRAIAASLGVSAGVVGLAVSRAKEASLTWEVIEAMDDSTLEGRLYPAVVAASARVEPDCEWIHRERHRPGVTLELLHHEYDDLLARADHERHRLRDVEPHVEVPVTQQPIDLLDRVFGRRARRMREPVPNRVNRERRRVDNADHPIRQRQHTPGMHVRGEQLGAQRVDVLRCDLGLRGGHAAGRATRRPAQSETHNYIMFAKENFRGDPSALPWPAPPSAGSGGSRSALGGALDLERS